MPVSKLIGKPGQWHRPWIRLLLLVSSSLLFLPALAADTSSSKQNIPPSLANALLAMNLDKSQRKAFGAEMQVFTAKLQSTVNRITKSRRANKPRHIKSKTRMLLKQLDKPMKKILREDQWDAYLAYKALYTNGTKQPSADTCEQFEGEQIPPECRVRKNF